MSKFFRSAESSSNSDSDSIDGNDEGLDQVEDDPSISNVGLDVITGYSNTQSSATRRIPNHRDILLHALLEERCMNEALASHHNVAPLSQVHRNSPEVQDEAQARYQRICRQLASLDLISSGLETAQHARTRQRYRDGLDILSQQRTTAVPPRLRRLLTDSEVELGIQAHNENSDVSGAVRLSHDALQTEISQPTLPYPLRRLLTSGEMVGHEQYANVTERKASFNLGYRGYGFPEPRYIREFEELSVLGRGGYGIVYHVKHRLDNQFYAIKKVPLSALRLQRIQQRGQPELDEVLRELRTLARLDHPNVVRYYTGWIEWVHPTTSTGLICSRTENQSYSGADDSIVSAVDDSKTESSWQTHAGNHSKQVDVVFEDSMSSGTHPFVSGFKQKPWKDRPSETSPDSMLRSKVSESNETAESIDRMIEESSNIQSGSSEMYFKGPTLALHMQMSLHPMTLADYLSPAAESTAHMGIAPPLSHCFHLEPTISILLAILDGVEYLHSEGVVHRDIKPGNIFIGQARNPRSTRGSVDLMLCSECRAEHKAAPIRLEVRIGDFGLVTFAGVEQNSRTLVAVGTKMYQPLSTETADSEGETVRAEKPSVVTSHGNVDEVEYNTPEITKSRDSDQDVRLDIYALGIVAFELLWKFSTRMERIETLQRLKQGEFPRGFSQSVGKHGQTIMECIRAMLSPGHPVSITKIKQVLSTMK